jgi:hypothetical protein
MEPVIGSYKISLTCLVRQAKAEDGAIPNGVAANIAAALLLTAAQGLLETFLALTPPKC